MLPSGTISVTVSNYGSCTISQRSVVTFTVFFLTAFSVTLVFWDGRVSSNIQASLEGMTSTSARPKYYGVVMSMKPERFNHTRQVLTQAGFHVDQKWPPYYKSEDVDKSLESYLGSREWHNSMNLKMWSNHMAHVSAITDFVKEAINNSPNQWRFFFEDDLALIPSITGEHGKQLIAKGLKLADKDGFIFLGLCGTNCEGTRVLDQDVEAARCDGTCTHAYGFQARTASKFLQSLSSIKLDDNRLKIYLDQYMAEYGRQVKKVWLVGSNLISPAESSHRGLLYQDRIHYPSTAN